MQTILLCPTIFAPAAWLETYVADDSTMIRRESKNPNDNCQAEGIIILEAFWSRQAAF
jgi:hypothetical protein